MEYFVFLPGIFGTELVNPELQGDAATVWPPTPFEILFDGYDRIDDLTGDRVFPTSILKSVSVCDVYGDFLRDLETVAGSIGADRARVVEFPYDWRKDLTETAARLADRLDELFAETADASISLIAHFMGGLICRYLIESGQFDDRSWHPDSLRRFVALATPHLGAPLALDRILGLSGTTGMSKDVVAELAANTDYPSAYQLLPGDSARYVRDITGGEDDAFAVDVLRDPFATTHALLQQNIGKLRTLRAGLDLAGRPEVDRNGARRPLEYVFFAGSGSRSVNGLTQSGTTVRSVRDRDSGDDTVATFSAATIEVPTIYANATHLGILGNLRVRRELFKILGARPDVRPAAAGDRVSGAADIEDISIPTEPVAPGTEFPIIVNFRIARPSFNARLRFEPRREDLPEEARDARRVENDIAYEGPPLESLKINVAAPQRRGFYDVGFVGIETDDPTPPLLRVAGAPEG